jgi:hypothetical protein
MRRQFPFRSSNGGWRDICVRGRRRLAGTQLVEAAVVVLCVPVEGVSESVESRSLKATRYTP